MFVSVAHAAGGAPGGMGGPEAILIQLMPLILMFVVFYFLLIRPQQKRSKEHRTMLAALKKGDHVLTSGGMLGRITEVEGDIMTIDLGHTQVKVVRGYISALVDPKNLEQTSHNTPQ